MQSDFLQNLPMSANGTAFSGGYRATYGQIPHAAPGGFEICPVLDQHFALGIENTDVDYQMIPILGNRFTPYHGFSCEVTVFIIQIPDFHIVPP